MKQIIPFNKDKDINNVDDYNDYASEFFDEYITELIEKGDAIRPVEEGDIVCHEEADFVFLDKPARLISKLKERLEKIGEAHFPDEFIEVYSYQFIDN